MAVTEFEAFVASEFGDIAVKSDGKYISQKINNYLTAWHAAQLCACTPRKCFDKDAFALYMKSICVDSYTVPAANPEKDDQTFSIDRSQQYKRIYAEFN